MSTIDKFYDAGFRQEMMTLFRVEVHHGWHSTTLYVVADDEAAASNAAMQVVREWKYSPDYVGTVERIAEAKQHGKPLVLLFAPE